MTALGHSCSSHSSQQSLLPSQSHSGRIHCVVCGQLIIVLLCTASEEQFRAGHSISSLASLQSFSKLQRFDAAMHIPFRQRNSVSLHLQSSSSSKLPQSLTLLQRLDAAMQMPLPQEK